MSAPMRKLQDLLTTYPAVQKDPPKLPPFDNKSFQNIPMEPCPLPSNPSNLAPGNYPFKNFPRTQNLFYHPLIKTSDNSYPSPMIQFPGFQNVRDKQPMFFAQQSQGELDNQANIYGSSINSEFLNSLSAMEGSKMSMLTQPKNLGELLQKSFLSTHSTTLLQSPFVSSNQSRYVGHNLLNGSYTQTALNPDYSNLLTASVLGTPLQPPQVIRNQNMGPQAAENSNEKLLFQLESLLKQENGRDIKMALAGLIHQYKGASSHPQRDLNGFARMQEDSSQRQGNQRTISLSNGFVMNTVNRSTAESGMRRFFDSTKGMNNKMGREGVPFNEASSKKRNYSVIPEEDSSMLGDLSFSQPTQNLLNQKLNSLNINGDTNENQKEIDLNMSYLPVDEELNAILEERIPHDKEAPGTYNREERTGKILKYKNKIRKWRREHPVNRNFKGRSVVAGKKPRIKGKFVTIEEYVEYIKTTNDNETDLQVPEHFNESTTYAGSERSTREHDLNIKEENF